MTNLPEILIETFIRRTRLGQGRKRSKTTGFRPMSQPKKSWNCRQELRRIPLFSILSVGDKVEIKSRPAKSRSAATEILLNDESYRREQLFLSTPWLV